MIISILLMYALCASSFTISKAVLAYSAPIFFVAIRMLAAGVILLGFLLLKGRLSKIKKRDLLGFIPIVLFHIYFAYVLDLWSLQYISSFKSSFFFSLSPFITALLSFFFLHERMTKNKWLGLLIGFIGLLPMLLKDVPMEEVFGSFMFISVPELVLLGAVLSSCIGWISLKRLLGCGYSPLFINGVGMLFGGFLALCTSCITERWFAISPIYNLWPFLGLTALIIIVCNIMFYNIYGHLLHRYTATFLSFAGFTCPCMAALFGFLFLGERVTWHFFVAIAVVSLGLYLFYQDELRYGYTIKNQVP
jgi:drug/metabolite transporter (DMT)-like permease